MSQYIFIEDFIILKSEIVSVQFDFNPKDNLQHYELMMSIDSIRDELRKSRKNPGTMTIIFVLKDGTSRIITERVTPEKFLVKRDVVIEQMKAIEPKPPSKTSATTTIRRVPVNP